MRYNLAVKRQQLRIGYAKILQASKQSAVRLVSIDCGPRLTSALHAVRAETENRLDQYSLKNAEHQRRSD